jgi:hypothetical protein
MKRSNHNPKKEPEKMQFCKITKSIFNRWRCFITACFNEKIIDCDEEKEIKRKSLTK